MHTIDRFFRTCVNKGNCGEIARKLEARLSISGIDPNEIALLRILDLYGILYTHGDEEPLGRFIGRVILEAFFVVEIHQTASKLLKFP